MADCIRAWNLLEKQSPEVLNKRCNLPHVWAAPEGVGVRAADLEEMNWHDGAADPRNKPPTVNRRPLPVFPSAVANRPAPEAVRAALYPAGTPSRC